MRHPARGVTLATMLLALSLCGCFTTFKTANTVDGGSLTIGAQRWTIEEGGEDETHTFLVALGRGGQAARKDRIGWELGARVVTDLLDHPERDAAWLFALEPRIQPHRNDVVDVSLGIELLSFVYPAGVSLHFSRDVTKWLTPYTEIKAQFLLWQLTHGDGVHEFFPRLTFGTALTSRRFGTLYVETEGYTNVEAEDGWRLNVGFELPPIREAQPDSLLAPP
jgi:hypothetical protein